MLKADFLKNEIFWGYLCIILGIILFSSVEVFSKLVTLSKPHLSPFWISSLRFLIAGSLFIPSFFISPKFQLTDLFKIFICSFFSVTLAITCFYQVSLMPDLGLGAGIGAVIFCSNPIFVILLSPVLAPEHHIGLHRLEGAVIAMLGVVVASWSAISGFGNSFIGMILMFIAAFLFGAQVPYSKKYILKYGGMKYLGALFLMGGATSLIIAFLAEGIPTQIQLTNNIWALLGYAVIACAMGYYFYFHGFKHVDAARGSQFFFLKPILAPIIAFLVLGENLSWSLVFGVIIILFGIKMAFTPRKIKLHD